MRVLVACEFSQIVTKAFRDRGHEAFSCDILPTEGNPEWHIQDDVLKHLDDGWDLMIGHPPCTYLSYVGTRHWNEDGRLWERLAALDFFARLWTAPIEKICLENPRGCASPVISKYSQEIQPYYWGDKDQKTIWLWLKNLPLLRHSNTDTLFEQRTHTDKPQPYKVYPCGYRVFFHEKIKLGNKQKDWGHVRSRFFPGIANAMADQWGKLEREGRE